MTYHCGIITDLLPLYIDGVCSEQSKAAVKSHLEGCEGCRQCCEAMKSADGLDGNKRAGFDDMKLADGLKSIKLRINKKIGRIAACSAAAVLALALVFQLLFVMPVREIALDDISVTASVYPIEQLAAVPSAGGEGEFRISMGEDDLSGSYSVAIPAMPNADITISEKLMEQNLYITVISWSSPYFIREMELAEGPAGEGDALYVQAFKTTVLNNRAPQYAQTAKNLEIREISRIVYVGDGGETVLWSAPGK